MVSQWSQLFRPATFTSYITSNAKDKTITALLMVGGATYSIVDAQISHYGDTKSIFSLLVINLALGILLGWIRFYIYAVVLKWTGEWIGGKASREQVISVVAYSLIPALMILPLMAMEFALYRDVIFKSSYVEFCSHSVPAQIIQVLKVLLVIYSSVLLISGLRDVQGFSTVKAFVNFVLPFALIALLLGIVLLLLMLLGSW